MTKLENSELINNVYHKKKLQLDTKINDANKKRQEIKEKIKHTKKLLNYYEVIYNQKNKDHMKLVHNFRKFCGEIHKGNLFLKKGAQLTQDNILCMDKYGKMPGDNTSFNDINEDRDYGKISDFYEESENNDNNENIDGNENENEEYNGEDGD